MKEKAREPFLCESRPRLSSPPSRSSHNRSRQQHPSNIQHQHLPSQADKLFSDVPSPFSVLVSVDKGNACTSARCASIVQRAAVVVKEPLALRTSVGAQSLKPSAAGAILSTACPQCSACTHQLTRCLTLSATTRRLHCKPASRLPSLLCCQLLVTISPPTAPGERTSNSRSNGRRSLPSLAHHASAHTELWTRLPLHSLCRRTAASMASRGAEPRTEAARGRRCS
jgi:hypothetical protein